MVTAFLSIRQVAGPLTAGLYSVLLEDWLKVFPREQIHIIRTDDHFQDQAKSVGDFANFLGLGKFCV